MRRLMLGLVALGVLGGCGSLEGAGVSPAPREELAHAGQADPQTYLQLHHFVGGSADGSTSHGSLTTNGTTLFGRTFYGGDTDNGVVFSMNPDGSQFRVIKSFTGKDGSNPRHDAMVLDGDVLYGTTLTGGHSGAGVVFSIKTDGGHYQVLQTFGSGKHNGNTPHSCPRLVDGHLYGMTEKGGEHDEGTLYKLHTSGKDFELLHSFHKSEGKAPHGAVLAVGSLLYGMTREGGSADQGVVFSFDLNSKKYVVLHSFAGGTTDGAAPFHGNLCTDGTAFYGLTHDGGTSNKGVVFKMDATGAVTLLYSFAGGSTDGEAPQGSLALQNGFLYGTTAKGGSGGHGTFFRIAPDGTGYQTLHSFSGGALDFSTNNDNVVFIGSTAYGMPQLGATRNLGGIFSQQVP